MNTPAIALASAHCHVFPDPPAGPVLSAYPRGFVVTAGAPVVRNWRYYAAHGDAFVASGLWECSEGSFAFTFEHWEFASVLTGRCRITPTEGTAFDLGPGSAFVFEPGFSGTWQVLETMRKHYVTRWVLPEKTP